MKFFYLDTGEANRGRNGHHFGYPADLWNHGILGPLSQQEARKASALISGKVVEYPLPTDVADQITQEVIDQATKSQKTGDSRPKFPKMIREMQAAEDFDLDAHAETRSYEEVYRVYSEIFQDHMRDQVKADIEDREDEEEIELTCNEMISEMAANDWDWHGYTGGSRKKEDVLEAYEQYQEEKTEVLA